MLAKDCQLFLVSNRKALDTVNTIAGELAATRPEHYVPVLKYRVQSDVLIAVTAMDSGLSVADYRASATGNILSYDAMRSILGETVQAIRPMLTSTTGTAILTTDTVRLTGSGIEISDAPFAPILADMSGTDPTGDDGAERHAVRQLAALLYALLTNTKIGRAHV